GQLPPYIRPDKFSRAPVRGNMNQGSWSPLPPCWEEQYDHVTRRNYFVDHNTRTTTWNRPPLIETEEEKEGRLQEYERTVRLLPNSNHLHNASRGSGPIMEPIEFKDAPQAGGGGGSAASYFNSFS